MATPGIPAASAAHTGLHHGSRGDSHRGKHVQGAFPLHENIGLLSSLSVTVAHGWELASHAVFVVDHLPR